MLFDVIGTNYSLWLWVPACVFGPGRLGRRNRCRARHRVPWGAPCVMELNLHANATTTPKVRAYIQRSRKAVASWPMNLASAKPPFAVGAAGPQSATARTGRTG